MKKMKKKTASKSRIRRSPDFVKAYGRAAPTPRVPRGRVKRVDAFKMLQQEAGRLREQLYACEDHKGLAIRRMEQVLNSGQLLDRFIDHLTKLDAGIVKLRMILGAIAEAGAAKRAEGQRVKDE